MESQSHYVCSNCGYTSKLPGTCQNDNCIRQGTRLMECHCDDGLHDAVLKTHANEEGDDLDDQKKQAQKNDYSVNTIDLDDQDGLEE